MDLHSLTFMGRNIENKKKLMLLGLMNSVHMLNSKSIMNSVGIFSDSATMNSNFNE